MPPLARAEGAALLDRFRRYLRDHRQPVTRQRDLIAQIVFLSEDHPSVDAIIRRLRERNEAVGTATVYRTLEVLVESRLVRAHDFGEGFKRYEPMSAQAHHEHLICERCGNVVEFQNERLERMLPSIADEHAFQHSRHRVEIYGVCHDCLRRELVVPAAEAG
jgi:Fur family transcriptional regulator, ferric uptake regulator